LGHTARIALAALGVVLALWAYGSSHTFLESPTFIGTLGYVAWWCVASTLAYLGFSGRPVRLSIHGALLGIALLVAVGAISFLVLRQMAGLEAKAGLEFIER
jgi:hypothetical protein